MIRRSRHLGVDSSPKTARSERTIPLPPELVQILKGCQPLHFAPHDFVFTNRRGGPVVQDEWSKTFWHRALRATGIRPRKFYATRHTYISLALSYGANPKHVAEYCGTSVMMIERHYGRFMGASDVDPLTAARAAASPTPELKTRAAEGAKPQTLRQTFEEEARFPFKIKASPTGFEPVLPA